MPQKRDKKNFNFQWGGSLIGLWALQKNWEDPGNSKPVGSQEKLYKNVSLKAKNKHLIFTGVATNIKNKNKKRCLQLSL